MNEITLPSRHIIRNLNPEAGLRPSTLPLGHGGSHNIQTLQVSGDDIICFGPDSIVINLTLNKVSHPKNILTDRFLNP